MMPPIVETIHHKISHIVTVMMAPHLGSRTSYEAPQDEAV
jgi:hypothetical protein